MRSVSKGAIKANGSPPTLWRLSATSSTGFLSTVTVVAVSGSSWSTTGCGGVLEQAPRAVARTPRHQQPKRSEGNSEKRHRPDAGQPKRSGGNPEKRPRRDAGRPAAAEREIRLSFKCTLSR